MATVPVLEPVPLYCKNLLFTTDFLPQSDAALRLAASMARNYGARLFILHAVQPIMFPGEAGLVEAEVLRRNEDFAQQTIGELRAHPDLARVEIEPIVCRGYIDTAIEECARERHIDLLIAATHSPRRLERFLFGSVSEAIARAGWLPVLIIGPGCSREEFRCRSVLLATSLEPDSLRPVQYATAFSQREQAELTLLHVCEAEASPADQRAAAEQLRTLLPAKSSVPSTTMCMPGEIATRVLEAAAIRSADLLVIGTRRAAYADHAPASITGEILRGASCPVLCVPEHLA